MNKTTYINKNNTKMYNVSPFSYTPDINIIRQRSPTMTKYVVPKDKGIIKRLQGYIDGIQKAENKYSASCEDSQELENYTKNTTNVHESYCFKSRVKKTLSMNNDENPGPGSYYNEESPENKKKGISTFCKAKKTTKFLNYNNVLLLQTQDEVLPDMGSYHNKSRHQFSLPKSFQSIIIV